MTDARPAIQRPAIQAGLASGAIIGRDALSWLGGRYVEVASWPVEPLPETVLLFLGALLGALIGRWLELIGIRQEIFPQQKPE